VKPEPDFEPELLRGSLFTLRRKCGKASCRCADGAPHETPALSYSADGRTKILTLRAEDVAAVAAALGRYQTTRDELDARADAGVAALRERVAGAAGRNPGGAHRPVLRAVRHVGDRMVMTPGRRKVTRMLRVADPDSVHAHHAYHRFLRVGVWSMSQLRRILAVRLVAALCPAGPVALDLDDTLFHKTGRNIVGSGSFRDAIASTKARLVHAHGLNLVVITVRVSPPWGGQPLGLPVNRGC
jgi:hypothetical protein